MTGNRYGNVYEMLSESQMRLKATYEMLVFHILLSNKIHRARLTWLEINAKLEIHY